MASRRTLKKNIHVICEALFAECVAVSLYSGKSDDDNTSALLMAVIKMQNNYISRVSHAEPKMPAKAYYKDLIEKFNSETSEIIDQITNLS